MMLLGIDPATYCGFACENGIVGTWHLKKKIKDQVQHPLLRIEHCLERAIREWGVDRIACEDAAGGSWRTEKQEGKPWRGSSTKTAAFHNQILGVIKLVAARHTLPLLVLHPATIKAFATKKAWAKKPMMRAALRLHHGSDYDIDELDDNAVDAIWILKYALANPYGPTKRKKKRKKPKLAATVDQGKLPF
jgi:Holliday junction resolvasome RuvABC endonuclease subunit